MIEQSKWHSGLMVTLRFLIGWHLLYEGIYKLISPEWFSIAFLSEAQWIFKGIAGWIINNQDVLLIVDFLNIWGLIAIGLGLVLGLFTRTAAIAGTVLLALYYLFHPPFIGIEASVALEGNYLFVNKNMIEAVMLLLIAVSPASRLFGLDLLFVKRRENKHNYGKTK